MMSLVQLRRSNTSVPWGFRMNGGADFKQPLYVQKVTPDSVSGKAGLRAGDVIRQICKTPTRHLTHEQAKMEIIRAGNELEFFVDRGAMPLSQMDDMQLIPEQPSSLLYNQSSTVSNDSAVPTRSFKVIQRSMMME